MLSGKQEPGISPALRSPSSGKKKRGLKAIKRQQTFGKDFVDEDGKSPSVGGQSPDMRASEKNEETKVSEEAKLTKK